MPKLPKTNSKELNKLIKAASQQGWRFKDQQKGGHIKCFAPDKKSIVTISATTKSLRGVQNAKGHFKQAGLKI